MKVLYLAIQIITSAHIYGNIGHTSNVIAYTSIVPVAQDFRSSAESQYLFFGRGGGGGIGD